jgi:catalase
MVPRNVTGKLQRKRPVSFGDHFSQATLFWNSMSEPERDHIVAAFSFELGKCLSAEVKERNVANLAYVDATLASRVAANLGIKAPRARQSATKIGKSPKLSLLSSPSDSIAGKVIGVLCADNVDSAGLSLVEKALEAELATVVVIGPRGGALKGTGGPVEVDKSELTTQSVEYDALVVAGGPGAQTLESDAYIAVNLGEAFRHYKTIAAWGEGQDVLEACNIPTESNGIVTSAKGTRAFATELITAIAAHRHWDR